MRNLLLSIGFVLFLLLMMIQLSEAGTAVQQFAASRVRAAAVSAAAAAVSSPTSSSSSTLIGYEEEEDDVVLLEEEGADDDDDNDDAVILVHTDDEHQKQRKLQIAAGGNSSDPLSQFQIPLHFGGGNVLTLDADYSQLYCPDPWGALKQCLVRNECAMGLTMTCPGPEEFPASNSNMPGNSSCGEVNNDLCEGFLEYEDCCFVNDCAEPFYSLVRCAIVDYSGEDCTDLTCAAATGPQGNDNNNNQKPAYEPGDEICISGFVMDRFCLDRGTLLDMPSIVSLENPELHSLHCIVDVDVCRNAGYNILQPTDETDETGVYGPGWAVTDNTLLVELGRSLGSQELGCTTCTNNGTFAIREGFHVVAKGFVTALDPPTMTITEADYLEFGFDDGCPTPSPPAGGMMMGGIGDLLGLNATGEACSEELNIVASCLNALCTNIEQTCPHIFADDDDINVEDDDDDLFASDSSSGNSSNIFQHTDEYCDALDQQLCETFAVGACCMVNCLAELQTFTTCTIAEESGVDLTDCPTATCDIQDFPSESPSNSTDASTNIADLLDAISIDFGSVALTSQVAQESCPNEWTKTVTCVFQTCSDFTSVFTGCRNADDLIGSAEIGTSNTSSFLIPTCQEIEDTICTAFSGEFCCLLDCTAEFRSLVNCVILETTEEDPPECAAPFCEETPTTDTAVELTVETIENLQFTYAGFSFDAEFSRETCPNEWGDFATCLLTDCSNEIAEVCPNLDEATIIASPEGPEVPAEIPDCNEIENDLCQSLFAGDDCCMRGCAAPYQVLGSCILLNATGVDRSECILGSCPSAPVIVAGNQSATQSEVVKGLEMTFLGIQNPLSPEALAAWKRITETYIAQFFADNPDLGVSDVIASITDIVQEIVATGRMLSVTDQPMRRRLQSSSGLQIMYSQNITYRTDDPDQDTAATVAVAPFASNTSRGAFVEALKMETNNTEFTEIEGIEEVTIVAESDAGSSSSDNVTEQPDSPTDGTPTDSPTDGTGDMGDGMPSSEGNNTGDSTSAAAAAAQQRGFVSSISGIFGIVAVLMIVLY